MRFSLIGVGLLIAVIFAVIPVQGFTAQNMNITIDQIGNAHVDITYSLNFAESAALFTGIGDPSAKIQNELEYNLGHPVTINTLTGSEMSCDIQNFATVNGNTYTTQSFTFQSMADKVQKYWFEGGSNFAPELITIQFPNGYQDTYTNRIDVPADTYIIQ
jgi:hypothetical protein